MTTPLEDGIAALKAGDKEKAYRLLKAATGREPNNPRAWKMLYNAAQSDGERAQILARLLQIAPHDPQVLALQAAQPPAPPRKCPFCAEAVQPEAQVCPHCQRNINPQVMKFERLEQQGKALQKAGCQFNLLLIYLVIFLCGVGMLYIMFSK